jgi:hypothetical protein
MTKRSRRKGVDMNSDSDSGGNSVSRRTVLRLASGAGFALVAGAVSGGRLVNTAIAQAGDTELVCNTNGVRIRRAPGLDGAVIGSLGSGAVVNLIGDPVSRDGYTWLNISPQANRNLNGWSAAQFFRTSQGGFGIGADVVTTDSVRLRRQAGLGGAVIRVVPKGTHAVTRSAPISSDGYTWYGVILDDGTEGFIAGEFLTRARVEPTGQRLRVVNGPLRLRQYPGLRSTVLASLPNGTVVVIADASAVRQDGYLWRYVRLESKPSVIGWIADGFTVAID